MHGGRGREVPYRGGAGTDLLSSDAQDTVFGDAFYGGEGDDVLSVTEFAVAGRNSVYGGAGDDLSEMEGPAFGPQMNGFVLTEDNGIKRVVGGLANFAIRNAVFDLGEAYCAGESWLYAKRDHVRAVPGDYSIYGTLGDTVEGADGVNRISDVTLATVGAGNDRLYGCTWAYGGAGDDTFEACTNAARGAGDDLVRTGGGP
jgi:hypothetical protein